MEINKIALEDEDLRIIANTEQFYGALLLAMRDLQVFPDHMSWKTVNGTDYLYEWRHDQGQPKSKGRRSYETEKVYESYISEKANAEARAGSITSRMASSLAQYKALQLPQIMELPGKILRELDTLGHLGTNLMVVGTNAFAAYEIEARERFAHGLDETEDFDLGWCRGSGISFLGVKNNAPIVGAPLFSTIKRIDPSFRVNPRKPYQAINKNGYEVELLAAPSVMKSLGDEEFQPAAILEQEWLLMGRPVRHVVCARDGSAAPLFVPDPRYMGLHKLWLSKKPERDPLKKPKDAQQGELLLSAVARKMSATYPMDADFICDLPSELVDEFNGWANRNSFIPPNQRRPAWW